MIRYETFSYSLSFGTVIPFLHQYLYPAVRLYVCDVVVGMLNITSYDFMLFPMSIATCRISNSRKLQLYAVFC